MASIMNFKRKSRDCSDFMNLAPAGLWVTLFGEVPPLRLSTHQSGENTQDFTSAGPVAG